MVILSQSLLSFITIFSGINFSLEEFHLIPGSKLLPIALVALVEIPTYLGKMKFYIDLNFKQFFTVNAFLVDIVGRKPMILFFTLVPAIGCIVTLINKHNTVSKTLLLIIKAAVAGSFTLIR